MPATPPEYFGNLDSTRPRGNESRNLSDDYQRNMRESCRRQAPNWTGAITATHEDVNKTAGLAAANAKIMTGTAGVTVAAYANPSAPIGWTIESGFEGRMLVTAGTINSTPVAGGGIGGSDDPGLNSKVPAHTHPDNFSVSIGNNGAHAHNLNYGTSSAGRFDSEEKFVGSANIGSGSPGIQGSRAGYVEAVGNHVHSATVNGSVSQNTGAANWTPRYAGLILCKLDA